MARTSTKTKSILSDEKVFVRYIPDFTNGVTDKTHSLYGGLSSNASIAIVAPILKGGVRHLFTEEEQEQLEDLTKLDLSTQSDFWKEYRTDGNGVNIGHFPIYLKKEGTMLDKSNPLDFIKLRVLERSNLVAPSPSEVKNRSKEYRFVLINENNQFKEDIDKMKYDKDAIKLHDKYEKDADVLTHILKELKRNPGPSQDIEFLQKETWKIAKTNPKEFYVVASDEYLQEKILLRKSLERDLVQRVNGQYFDEKNQAISFDNDNSFEGAAKFLASGAGQEYKLILQKKLKAKKD